ncbi:hypothetical protein VB711_06295 [Cronbergia sp. UHCC 0137]|uniref:hypothetical protein n=1 Tax=Cronbergia sp. UHCC 0137 TaxID=3110239 RepID=UPI002B215321|nr:hypothetical protein [Cronbergia sp. UHCC 0137]MEA5617447.1 hypothetical protein [Cronbergia sp. UHCC 0137]
MGLRDGLLLTLVNTIACLAVPKLLSVISANGQNKNTATVAIAQRSDSNSSAM